MDLKKFVKKSIVQMSKRIEEANVALKDSEVIVNPAYIQMNSNDAQGYGRTIER